MKSLFLALCVVGTSLAAHSVAFGKTGSTICHGVDQQTGDNLAVTVTGYPLTLGSLALVSLRNYGINFKATYQVAGFKRSRGIEKAVLKFVSGSSEESHYEISHYGYFMDFFGMGTRARLACQGI